MESDVKLRYLAEFGEMPPLFVTMTYEDEWYQKKMEEAIKNRKPITESDLDEIQDSDLVMGEPKKGFSNFKNKSDSEPKDPEKE